MLGVVRALACASYAFCIGMLMSLNAQSATHNAMALMQGQLFDDMQHILYSEHVCYASRS